MEGPGLLRPKVELHDLRACELCSWGPSLGRGGPIPSAGRQLDRFLAEEEEDPLVRRREELVLVEVCERRGVREAGVASL